MINLLLRKYKNMPGNNIMREKLGTFSSFVGIGCNVLLFAVKLIAGFLSGSVAVMADAFNNLSDAGSSVVTLLGIKLAAKPADEEHPFGHGRFEYFASLIISMIIMGVGISFLKSSVERIITPAETEFSVTAVIILVSSIAVKLWLGFFYKKAGKLCNSSAIEASGQDSINDVLVTSVTMISLIVSLFVDFSIDGFIGIAVSLFVIWSGIQVAHETIDTLLGGPADPELAEKLRQLMMEGDGVFGVHDMVIHNYGPGRIMASAHVEVPSDANILESHDMIDLLEKRALIEYRVPLVIHLDPIDVTSQRTIEMRAFIESVAKEIDSEMDIHDFRMVTGRTHTNLIFDLTVPYSMKMTNTQLKKLIDEKIKSEKGNNYYTVITFDRSYL